jgi:hypothetical protein
MKFLIRKVIKMKPRKHPCVADAILKEETRSAYMFLMEMLVVSVKMEKEVQYKL